MKSGRFPPASAPPACTMGMTVVVVEVGMTGMRVVVTGVRWTGMTVAAMGYGKEEEEEGAEVGVAGMMGMRVPSGVPGSALYKAGPSASLAEMKGMTEGGGREEEEEEEEEEWKEPRGGSAAGTGEEKGERG